jgi:GT2 family glycosyltransferase
VNEATLPQLNNSPISSPALNKYAVVILNRYPELAEKFIASIRQTHDPMPSIVVVRDRNDATYGDDVKVVDGRVPFVFAANANIGIQYYADRDVFLCNDDIEIEEKDFFPTFHAISRVYPKCGLMSPLIRGGVGNGIQSYFQRDEVWKKLPNEVNVGSTVCFPCVLLKRKMIRRIGLLDENFTGYGLEDDDYCIRVRMGGFWTMVTKQLYIKHGNGEEGLHRGDNYSLSFAREPMKYSPIEYFNNKYRQLIQRPTLNSGRV